MTNEGPALARTMIAAADPFARLFAHDRLTFGLVLPLTAERGAETSLEEQLELAALAERLGFDALWVRDVPLNSPDYPDPQAHLDPWVLLGALSARTSRILLGTAAIAAPVRHPLHIAKGALSVAAASGGRFILGMGSGDRLPEFAAFGRAPERRREIFRDVWTRVAAKVAYEQQVLTDTDEPGAPSFAIRPAPPSGGVPMVAVGSAQQTLGWIARNAGAWLTYYRTPEVQRDRIALWHDAVSRPGQTGFRGLGTSFQLELLEKPDAAPEPLPLGLRTGAHGLCDALREQRTMGVHHILFNIASGSRPVADTLHALGDALGQSSLA